MMNGSGISSPPEDRERSPHTGWTRAHWEHIADVLLEGVRRYSTKTNGLIFLPRDGGRRKTMDGLEGFARTFLLAAYRLAGAGGQAPGDLADRYASGLRAGTGGRGADAWPKITDLSQPIVEAAFIALALFETRPWIWDRLESRDQEHVVAWLSGIQSKRVWHNNWVLFQVIVNAFLKSIGAPHRDDEILHGLDLVDSWYRRDGWYSDGAGTNFDYYVGWGIHFFCLMWSRLDGDRSDPARAGIYGRRALQYLDSYRYFFAANGAPIYHGRSLTYRFATVAPLWAGALLESTPLQPGETRRIASGVLRHFVERGAIRDGLLTRGWYAEFPAMVQSYSGHGSQYWASQAFLGLLLPAEHPVWTASEEPMPVERGDFIVTLPEPGFVLRGTRKDGIVSLSSHRSDKYPLPVPRSAYLRRAAVRSLEVIGAGHQIPSLVTADPHYRKLSYSTHAGPNVKDDDLDIDSQITLIRPDGKPSRRVRIHTIAVVDRFAASAFYPDEPNWTSRIETVSISWGAAEIRVHHVTSVGKHDVRDGGFAIASEDELEVTSGDVWAMADRSGKLASFIGGLYGFESAGTRAFNGANPFGEYSVTPYLVARKTSIEAVYVSVVVLAGIVDPALTLGGIGEVKVEGRQVSIDCRDGERFFVQLVAAEDVDRPFGSWDLRGPVRFARVSTDGSHYMYAQSS